MGNRDDIKIVLGSERFKSSTNTDLSIPIGLDNTQRELDEFDRVSSVNLAQVFNNERQKSTIFRPTSKLSFIFSNEYSGTTGVGGGYSPFTNYLYLVNDANSFSTTSWSGYPQYVEFDFIRTDFNISGYTINDGLTPPHVDFVKKSGTTYNWEQYLSYAYDNDYDKTMQYYYEDGTSYTWKASDGIHFKVLSPYNGLGKGLISFICISEHNLSVGQYVQINIPGYTGESLLQVYSVGNGEFNSNKYIFNVFNYGFQITNNSLGTFKKILDINNSGESMSRYYVRRHKILTSIDDAVLTKSGFEHNPFQNQNQFVYSSQTKNNKAKIAQKEGSQSYLISFKKDIDVSQYFDNLNRPLSKLYVTIINKGYFGWFNKPTNLNEPYSSGLRQGFGFNINSYLSEYWSAQNFNNNKTAIPTNNYTRNQYKFYYNENLNVGDIIDGDFCEYNNFEMIERVISKLCHKITYNSELFKISYIDGGNPATINQRIANPQGYYYSPHYSITLREFSSYIEEGNSKNIVNIPNYAFYSSKSKLIIWRDMYDYGYIDNDGVGVDYPFLNGTHYPSNEIIFKLIPEGVQSENINVIFDPKIDECE